MAHAPFSLLVRGFPPGHFLVHEVDGRERMNEPYAFDVEVSCSSSEEIVEHAALGQRAALLMRVGTSPRAVHGVVSRIESMGPRETHGVHVYRVRVVPRLWLLKKRKGSRIFQNLSVDQVVERLLQERGVTTRWELAAGPPVRDYCTQYEETDYAFVTRLLAEAGIFFYFVQPPELLDRLVTLASGATSDDAAPVLATVTGAALGAIADELFGGEIVVFSDQPLTYPPIPDGSLASAVEGVAQEIGLAAGASVSALGAGASVPRVAAPRLWFLTQLGAQPGFDKITRFVPARTVRSNRAEFRDYDPLRPNAPLVATQALAGQLADVLAGASVALEPALGASVQVGGQLGGVASAVASLGPLHDLELYEHHGEFLFPKWSQTSREPATMLRQARRHAHVAAGEGTCPLLTPGHAFRLDDHPTGALNATWVVTSVRHRGRGTAPPSGEYVVYENAFECAPHTVAVAPKRPVRRRVLSTLTATVVGPQGEEIHTDELGQIKVRFHWDREGARDDDSSCWMRTVQTWGGPSWGTQFIPRVGMEVLVVFEGSDPDKPIVAGCVYNGTHPPPFKLPKNKTRSGFKTSSSPGSAGFNELSFEDATGAEQIYVHAQRDLDVDVERDHVRVVGANETLKVSGDRIDQVAGRVEERVDKAKDARIAGDESHEVMGNRLAVVHGSEDRRVSKDRTTRIEGRDDLDVSGNASHRYRDDVTVRVDGCHTVIAGRHDSKRSLVLHAEGVATLSSTEVTEIVADKELVLRCGKSMLRITADKIEIVAPSVSGDGGGTTLAMGDTGMTIAAKDETRILTGKVLLKTEGASMSMGTEVKLDGQQILLNSPDRAKDPPPKEPAKTTKIELTDQEGRVLAHQRWLVVLEDGTERSGVLDADGRAEIQVEQSGKIYFPDLSAVEAG